MSSTVGHYRTCPQVVERGEWNLGPGMSLQLEFLSSGGLWKHYSEADCSISLWGWTLRLGGDNCPKLLTWIWTILDAEDGSSGYFDKCEGLISLVIQETPMAEGSWVCQGMREDYPNVQLTNWSELMSLVPGRASGETISVTSRSPIAVSDLLFCEFYYY